MGCIFPNPNKLSSADCVYVEGLGEVGISSRPPTTLTNPNIVKVLLRQTGIENEMLNQKLYRAYTCMCVFACVRASMCKVKKMYYNLIMKCVTIFVRIRRSICDNIWK